MLMAFILENKNITDLEHHAAHLFEAEAEEVKQNQQFQAKHEFVYNLILNQESTKFTFSIEESGSYRIFTEHHPEEFQMKITKSTGVVNPEDPIEYEGHEHGHSH
ncbi:hypothetical protein AWH56_020385 [Anaerobacillus isosaccharinicus]|uniref:Uncharacterized protein n=1 Tax=Anaerobacillus isosaccharinicus TaxID=1532552 RepID=A0A1S2KY30_9BACI|nr:hypothetical protein [Anaerobacillus isosaccharinicus]MBA5586734.1 hypothetical protein [Anaerobacillus isosaccharinicus]QOY35044.1 hypothetical protein AWH56_020385 [Anaerobacillus isosaccharinicus]